MLAGTIIENSLADTSILDQVEITKTWQAGSWILHKVKISEELARDFGKFLAEGPWYVHFWAEDKDAVLVVFRDKTFNINASDKATWVDAITQGISLGIPKEQLDFIIDQ